MPLPYQLAVHVERDDLPGAEPGVNAFAVGDRTRRRKIVLFVDVGEVALRVEAVLPDRLAALPVERGDEEADAVGRLCAHALLAAAEGALAGHRQIRTRRQRRMVARTLRTGAVLRCHEDPVLPD